MNYRSYYLAKEFVKDGDKVTIFAGSFSHLFSNYPQVNGKFTAEKIDGIDYIWVKVPAYKSSKSIGRIWNMLIFMINLFFFNIKKREKPDVIIISSLSLFPVANAYWWSRFFKVPMIFEIRDLWPQTLIELGNLSSRHPLVLFFGFFEKFGYKKADSVVSLLENAKEYMISRGMKPEKFNYIPNGINLEEVENSEPLCDEILQKLPRNKFIVGYVGTLGIANALDFLLDAALELRSNSSVHFVIVGKGGEKVKLQEFCKIHALDNVTFIDPIRKQQVQTMLKSFNICYIGLKKESLFKYGISPNKLFDYMYAAKPILMAIETSTNIIEDASCGLQVLAEDSQAIVQAIFELKNMNISILEEMGQNAKRYVLEYHSYNNLAKKYKELFS
jgi:glycosyltransferase involved in cell wall biosynthesis